MDVFGFKFRNLVSLPSRFCWCDGVLYRCVDCARELCQLAVSFVKTLPVQYYGFFKKAVGLGWCAVHVCSA